MSLILRNIKGSPLTYTEMDDNLTYLDNQATSAGTGTFLPLSGGTMSGDITMGTGTTIGASSGNSQLDLRYGGSDSELALSTDAGGYGEAILYLSNGYSSFSSNNGNDIDIYSSASPTSVNGIFFEGTTNRSVLYTKNLSGKVDVGIGELSSVSGLHISNSAVTTDLPINVSSGNSQLDLRFNNTDDQVSLSPDSGASGTGLIIKAHGGPLIASDAIPSEFILGTENSSVNQYTIASGIVGGNGNILSGTSGSFVENSVILGGTGITGNSSNTVYVPDIKIQEGKAITASDNAIGTYMSTLDNTAYVWVSDGYASLSDFSTNAYVEVWSDKTMLLHSQNFEIEFLTNAFKINGLPTYADNAAATGGGLPVDAVYKTATGELRIVV